MRRGHLRALTAALGACAVGVLALAFALGAAGPPQAQSQSQAQPQLYGRVQTNVRLQNVSSEVAAYVFSLPDDYAVYAPRLAQQALDDYIAAGGNDAGCVSILREGVGVHDQGYALAQQFLHPARPASGPSRLQAQYLALSYGQDARLQEMGARGCFGRQPAPVERCIFEHQAKFNRDLEAAVDQTVARSGYQDPQVVRQFNYLTARAGEDYYTSTDRDCEGIKLPPWPLPQPQPGPGGTTLMGTPYACNSCPGGWCQNWTGGAAWGISCVGRGPSPQPQPGPTPPNPGPNPNPPPQPPPTPPSPTPTPNPIPQPQPMPNPAQADQFRNQMLLYAQAILQDAGRISKEMTDAMDVTKHNDVGIKVALTSYLGAAGKMMQLVGSACKVAAAAGGTAAQESEVLQIASEAASESGTLTGQGGQMVGELEALGSGTSGTVADANAAGYLEDVVPYGEAQQPAVSQNPLYPACGVLSCQRLANLLGRNTSITQAFDQITVKVTMTFETTATGQVVVKEVQGGLSLYQLTAGLRNLGIQAKVGSGLSNLVKAVTPGRPVIAGIRTMEPPVTVTPVGQAASTVQVPLHALVVEGLEVRGTTIGLKIYDPAGLAYWQPLTTFTKYFTGGFVWPQ